MPVYTATRTLTTAVVAQNPEQAAALLSLARWVTTSTVTQQLPDEPDGEAIVTGPEALHAHNLACAWADDPTGDTIADQAAYHRWAEADALAGTQRVRFGDVEVDIPRDLATWVGGEAA